MLPLLLKKQNGDFLFFIPPASSAFTSGVKWIALFTGHSLCDLVRLDTGPALMSSLQTGMDLHRGLFELSTSVSDSLRFRALGDDLVSSSEFGDVGRSRVEAEVKERALSEQRLRGEQFPSTESSCDPDSDVTIFPELFRRRNPREWGGHGYEPSFSTKVTTLSFSWGSNTLKLFSCDADLCLGPSLTFFCLDGSKWVCTRSTRWKKLFNLLRVFFSKSSVAVLNSLYRTAIQDCRRFSADRTILGDASVLTIIAGGRSSGEVAMSSSTSSPLLLSSGSNSSLFSGWQMFSSVDIRGHDHKNDNFPQR